MPKDRSSHIAGRTDESDVDDDEGALIFLTPDAGNAEKVRHTRSVVCPSELSVVAEAVVAYRKARCQPVYVEERDEGYRWSPAYKNSGPHPLLREIAAFLECSHLDLIVGGITVSGWSIIATAEEPKPRRWSVIETPPSEPSAVADLITALLAKKG